MKPTREEIIAIAFYIHSNNYNTNLLWNEDANISDIGDYLERFAIAMYRKGQEDMREKSATIKDK